MVKIPKVVSEKGITETTIKNALAQYNEQYDKDFCESNFLDGFKELKNKKDESDKKYEEIEKILTSSSEIKEEKDKEYIINIFVKKLKIDNEYEQLTEKIKQTKCEKYLK